MIFDDVGLQWLEHEIKELPGLDRARKHIDLPH